MKIKLTILGIVLVIVFISFYFFLRSNSSIDKSENKVFNSSSSSVGIYSSINTSEVIISSSSSQQLITNDINTYISPDKSYTYNYSSLWNFSRPGIGLYPSNDPNYPSNNIEILTIFAVKSNQSPKQWATSYDGSGYKVEKEVKVNNYDAYYVINQNDSLTDINYTIAHNGLIIHSHFRQIDKTRQKINIDNTKYIKDMESIINSIKFLN